MNQALAISIAGVFCLIVFVLWYRLTVKIMSVLGLFDQQEEHQALENIARMVEWPTDQPLHGVGFRVSAMLTELDHAREALQHLVCRHFDVIVGVCGKCDLCVKRLGQGESKDGSTSKV